MDLSRIPKEKLIEAAYDARGEMAKCTEALEIGAPYCNTSVCLNRWGEARKVYTAMMVEIERREALAALPLGEVEENA